MPSRKTQFANDEIYHVMIRSVGDTPIFLDENDHFRGIFSLYEFNNSNPIEIWKRRRDRVVEKKREKEKTGGCPTPPELLVSKDERENLVEILAFVLMSNHIHLLIKQIQDNGISNFMKKVGGGYANYFNKKYKRKGHLFCTFQSVHVENDSQLRNVFAYIHCNPISFIESGWKEKGIKDSKNVKKFLEDYKWSSYGDYIGNKNFPSVTSRGFILDMLNKENGCKHEIENWVDYKSKSSEFGFSEINLD